MPYERTESYQPTGIDSGNAAEHLGLAGALQNFQELTAKVGGPIVADLGAAAGSTKGAKREGGTLSPVGPYNRAYNDAFLRSYTLGVYADTEEDFQRLEADANGDPAKFNATAQARRDAMLAETLPAAQPYVRATIDQRITAANARLVSQSIKAKEDDARESTLRGLDTMRRDASRFLTSGTEEGTVAGVKMAMTYGSVVDQQVAAGLLQPAEGQKLVQAALRDNARDIALGRFEAQASQPGGDPVKIIRETMESDDPNFDDATRQAVGGEMMQRLAQKQALLNASGESVDAEQKARWAASAQKSTVELISGTLTTGAVARRVANGEMDPALGRTLFNSLTQGSDAASDDQDSVHTLLINWRNMSTQDVLALPGLSNATRNKFIGEISNRQATWQDSNEYQEGARTIARSVGVSLENLGLATADGKEKLAIALTRYDRELGALPPEERLAAAIPKADELVATVIHSQQADSLQNKKRRRAKLLEDALKDAGVDSIEQMDSASRAELEDKLKKRDAAIEKLEKQSAGP